MKLAIFLTFFSGCIRLFAQEQTFIKEYTYNASELDSRNSCRAIATNQLRLLLLNEVGVYVESESILKTSEVSGEFAQDFVENIATISAGVTKLEILDEKWDGETFWMQAKITIDPKNIEQMLLDISKDRKRTKELEEIKLQLAYATKELEQIKEAIGGAPNQRDDSGLIDKYESQIKTLTSADYFLNGKERFNNRKFDAAIEAFTKSIELEPTHNQAYGGRGFAKYALGNYHAAILDLNIAIETYPEFADAYYSLRGLAKGSLGDLRGSIDDFTKAFSIDPNFAEAVSNRAVSKRNMNDYQGALEDYDLALKIDPTYSRAYFKRGLLKIMQLKEKEDGCLDLSKAGELGESLAYEAIRDLCN